MHNVYYFMMSHDQQVDTGPVTFNEQYTTLRKHFNFIILNKTRHNITMKSGPPLNS